MSFLACPTEILASILAFDCTSHKSIALFLTGSPILQLKLVQCVTSITLKSNKKYLTSRLPKLLTAFPKLRSLHVSCHPQAIFDLDSSVEVLKGLRSKLETLEMKYESCEILLGRASSPGDDLPADIPSLFPSLTTLSLASHSFGLQTLGSQLPSSLTCLTLTTALATGGRLMPQLPSSLTELHLLSLAAGEEKHLPPNLLSLSVTTPIRIDYAELPRSLTCLNASLPRMTMAQINALPPLIKEIKCSIFEHTEEILKCLPLSLETLGDRGLYFSMLPAYLKHLPRTMKALSLTFQTLSSDFKAADWPPMLAELNLQGAFSTSFWHSLPASITTLRLDSTQLSQSDLALLPSTLIEFETVLKDEAFTELPLPPHLQKLSLTNAVQSAVDKIKWCTFRGSQSAFFHDRFDFKILN